MRSALDLHAVNASRAVPETRGTIFSMPPGGPRRKESVPNLIQTPGLAAIVAMLRKRAQQMEVKLPPDVALYIAQNVQSNASALEAALLRLAAHSSLTGTAITLTYTQRVLKDFIGAKARKVAVDCLQKLTAVARGTK